RANTVCPLVSEKKGSSAEPGTQLPTTTAPSVARAPSSDASTTAPLRILYMYRPTNSAMGMVQAMVKVPQELPGTTWTQPGGNVTAPFAPGARGPASAGRRTWNDSGRASGLPAGLWRPAQPAGKVYSGWAEASSASPAGRVICIPSARLTSSPPSALTTTNPSPARAMTTMNRMAADTTALAHGPSSLRAISASDLPPRRTDAASTSMSCTAPARQTPITSHNRPGT